MSTLKPGNDGNTEKDLSEVGVNIVDPAGNAISGKFTGAKLLKLRSDGKWLQLQDKGEINMDTQGELTKFMDAAIKYHPGDKYAMTFWNHGSGWQDPPSPPPSTTSIFTRFSRLTLEALN